MRNALSILLIAISVLIFTSCSSGMIGQALPTTTPYPLIDTPIPTWTQLPQATVTPFPTATRSGDEPVLTVDATPTPEPQPTTGYPNRPEGVLDWTSGEPFYISQYDRNWPTIDDGQVHIYLSGGKYVFEINTDARRYIATDSINEDNFYTQVEINPVTCPETAGYGLFFRLQDGNNYYALTVFCNNRLTVYARAGGDLITTPLVDTTLPSNLSANENGVHVIGILALDNVFTVYFDTFEVAVFESDLHPRGDIALYAANPTYETMRVDFDNLVFWLVR